MGHLHSHRERSLAFRRSQKTFLVGWSIVSIGVVTAVLTFACASQSPELISLQAAKSSSILVLIVALNVVSYVRWSILLVSIGLLIVLIGYLNKRDEDDGKAPIPPEFEEE